MRPTQSMTGQPEDRAASRVSSAPSAGAPIGMAAFDRELRYVGVNDVLAGLHGVPPGAHLGRSIREVTPGEPIESEALLALVRDTGQARDVEIAHRDVHGLVRRMRVSYHLLCADAGSVGVTVIEIDGVVEAEQRRDEAEARRRATEARLVDREATLRSLAESSVFMMGVVELPDDDSEVVHVFDSPASCRFLGVPPGSTPGRTTSELGVPAAMQREWLEHYRDAERRGEEVRFEYEHPTEQGSMWFVSVVRFVGRTPSGKRRFSYVTEDITARKRAERLLHERDTYLRLAMVAAMTIAFDWDVVRDRVSRLQSVEEALPETSDQSATFEDVVQVVHPEDRARFRANIRAAFESPDGVYRSEFRIRRPSGELRWLLERGRVEFDTDHRPLRLIGISQDITDRRRDEDKLRRQARLIELSHDPILVWSPEGGIIDWNAGAVRLYGYTREEAAGRDIHALLQSVPSQPVAEILARLERDGEWTGEIHHTAKDGRSLVVESRQQTIDVDGRRLILESNRDITERKRAEDALREADRRKDEFIAVLAHELRNPLAPVRNAVEILQRCGPTDERHVRACDVIARQVTHMSRIIDDLLDVSRIARGKLVLRREPSDVAAIARQTAVDYGPLFEAAGIELVATGAVEPLWVDGDPVRLAQMIGNLVGNALRFTRRGGRVEVRAAVDEAGHAAEISVIDTGIGIDPAFVPRVFDPFSQADQGLARTQGGLGLGLALTRGLTELHGGTITAHSDGSGRGASFVIRIPLREVRPTPLAPRVGRQLHAPAEHGLRVLVVEDQPDAAETLGELLEILGHRVQVASDGATALSAAREFHPDAVISDLGLPGELDGYGLARALRAEPSLRDVFLLALSGYADPEARRRSTQAGFDVHLAKPLDVRDLERALTAVDAR